MIKKIILIILLLCSVISCGVKSNPEYKDPEKKTDLQIVLKNKA